MFARQPLPTSNTIPQVFASNRTRVTTLEISDEARFQHSWWRILLIIFTFITFIVTCVFNGLSATGPNGIFNQRIGDISDENLTEFTPTGRTFTIWAIIYIWQAAWLIYAITRIPRKSDTNYLYRVPNTLHCSVFILFAFNMGLNIAWLLIWDREYFGWSLLVIFFMLLTIVIPFIITHALLQQNRPIYVRSKRVLDIWLVRLFVHNGFAIYGTWLYLAMLLNLTIWISQIYDRSAESILATSTTALSLVLVGIVFYFIVENFIFYSALAYTYLTWFVLIFALSGIVFKNGKRNDVSKRNKSFALALLIICCVLLVIRILIFIVRYIRGTIPTLRNP